MKSLATLSLLTLAACLDGPTHVDPKWLDDRPGTQAPAEEPPTPPAPDPAPELVAVTTDFCDDPVYANATWQSYYSPHFVLQYLPGTPAESDRLVIAARLENAYNNIRARLGITAEPVLTVNLSPNRMAALQHNRGLGRGWPNLNRYDVIYTGAWDSYEVVRPGQMLTLMLDYQLDATNRTRLPLLTTGVAEYLDQSARDMHRAYALQLEAGIESRVHIAELDGNDVYGRNPGRAGSLVKFLIDRYGMATFVELYRASTVSWNGSCYTNPTYGCVSTPQQVTAMLNGLLATKVHEDWAAVQPLWQDEVERALNSPLLGMASNATQEIQNLVALMDQAISTKDAAMYRSTMEGFYCDWGGDALRAQIADRVVSAYGTSTSKVLAIFDTGTKNFWTAQALVQRTDDHGATTYDTVMFEHLPVGWRVSYGPDWY